VEVIERKKCDEARSEIMIAEFLHNYFCRITESAAYDCVYIFLLQILTNKKTVQIDEQITNQNTNYFVKRKENVQWLTIVSASISSIAAWLTFPRLE